jgi:hypothetical protein
MRRNEEDNAKLCATEKTKRTYSHLEYFEWDMVRRSTVSAEFIEVGSRRSGT